MWEIGKMMFLPQHNMKRYLRLQLIAGNPRSIWGNCKRMLLQKTGEAEKERERSWFYLDGIQDPKNPDVVCFALILFSTKEKFHFQIMRQKLRFINIQRSSFQYILYLYPLWYNISPNLFSLYNSLCWVLYCGA